MKYTTKVASTCNLFLTEKKDWLQTMNTGKYIKQLSHRSERHEGKLATKKEAQLV